MLYSNLWKMYSVFCKLFYCPTTNNNSKYCIKIRKTNRVWICISLSRGWLHTLHGFVAKKGSKNYSIFRHVLIIHALYIQDMKNREFIWHNNNWKYSKMKWVIHFSFLVISYNIPQITRYLYSANDTISMFNLCKQTIFADKRGKATWKLNHHEYVDAISVVSE